MAYDGLHLSPYSALRRPAAFSDARIAARRVTVLRSGRCCVSHGARDCCRDDAFVHPLGGPGFGRVVMRQRTASDASQRHGARLCGHDRRRGFGSLTATGPSGLVCEVSPSRAEAGVSGLVPDAQVAVGRALAPAAP